MESEHMSSGFWVVIFVALLLVVLPSGLWVKAAWRWSRAGRTAAISAVLVLTLLGVATLAEEGPVEERLLVFLAVWGVVLLVIGGAALLAFAGKKVRALLGDS